MEDSLRQYCKIIKAMQGISYKEMSTYIDIAPNSFYCWLKGYYSLSNDKQSQLREILDTIKE